MGFLKDATAEAMHAAKRKWVLWPCSEFELQCARYPYVDRQHLTLLTIIVLHITARISRGEGCGSGFKVTRQLTT